MKLYSDLSLFSNNLAHIPLLYPFFGVCSGQEVCLEEGTFDEYIKHSMFQIVDIESADYTVLPIDWNLIKESDDLIQAASLFIRNSESHNKKTIIFHWSDFSNLDILDFTNCIVFATSLRKSQKKSCQEYGLPFWSEDILFKYYQGEMIPRIWNKTPTIGFCGYARSKTWKGKIRKFLINESGKLGINVSQMPATSWHEIRYEVLSLLQTNKNVETNFLIRNSFWGGAVNTVDKVEWDQEMRRKVRFEYINNIIHSDYSLCIRGTGNFSHRLYETLCCGRIPVFVNTDCVLPYEFAIEWKKYCVWVEEDEIPKIAEKVAAFHEQISPQDFIDLQYECRKLWKEWLSPEGFFNNFDRHFL
jgi:Exostosin family